MKHVTELVRDAGYEALFHLGGFLALALHPTHRNQERIFAWIHESQSRREQLKRLQARGLVVSGTRNSKGGEGLVLHLTALGQAAFAGGRHPEVAWDRPWDGKWRLLSFDLPSKEREARMKLRRWLCANFFGKLQGSVWVHPDPIPAVEEVLESDRIDSSMFMVFEGGVAGTRGSQEVATMAWDFSAINEGYRRYTEFASRAAQRLQGSLSSLQLRDLLCEDRKWWWEAVRRDPLLPRELLPKGYEGTAAWKLRGKLLKGLGKTASK